MMNKKSIFLCLLICLLSLSSQIESLKNPGRQLTCWPDVIKFEEFPIDVYISTQKIKDKQYYTGNRLGIDDFDFDPRRRTTVLVHGFHGSSNDDLMQKLKSALLRWQNMNVIALDWRVGSTKFLWYHVAVVNTEYLALFIRSFFRRIVNNWRNNNRTLSEWGPVHFIGHSLGAHAVGQAAELLRKEGFLIDRVTGLDPAEPCFDNADNSLRLAKSNAKFVDVIHTDIAVTKNAAFGLKDPLGHADFYVNGGTDQPGCKDQTFDFLNVFDVKLLNQTTANPTSNYLYYDALGSHVLMAGSCFHVRALEVFVHSVEQNFKKNCKFSAHWWNLNSTPEQTQRILQTPCNNENCVEMGINAELYNYKKHHVFYVTTSGSAPFCNV